MKAICSSNPRHAKQRQSLVTCTSKVMCLYLYHMTIDNQQKGLILIPFKVSHEAHHQTFIPQIK